MEGSSVDQNSGIRAIRETSVANEGDCTGLYVMFENTSFRTSDRTEAYM
jgi:hypothetical protein